MKNITTEDIDYKECQRASHFKANDGSTDDLVVVKEVVTDKDGKKHRRIVLRENQKRPFYITKEAFRNHHEKKEWEAIGKVKKYMSTDNLLPQNICRALGGHPTAYMRQAEVQRSPYVYGSDTAVTTLIKNYYDRKIPEGVVATPLSIAVLDLETDTLRGTGEIVTGAIVTDKEVFCYFTDAYEGGETLLIEKLRDRCVELLQDRIDVSNIKIHLEKVAGPENVTIECLARAHEIKPDLMVIWNMKFDIPKMEESLTNAGLDPAEYFSDPGIPKKYRHFKFREAKQIKVMASGKSISKHHADLWHVVEAPCSFYVIDAMCLYKLVRVAKGMLQSYGLDFILKHHKLGGKLKFEEADAFSGLEWHVVMSRKHKQEYIAYNIYDCLSIIQLDKMNKDCALVFKLLIGHSDFDRFTSTPKRLADDYGFLLESMGRVAGTASDQMEMDIDKLVVDIGKGDADEGWIVTLKNHQMHYDSGIDIFGGNCGSLASGVMVHGFDSDVRSAYPETEIALNVSKETTHRELCSIEGIDLGDFRKITINMAAPRVNAVELCQRIHDFPSMFEMDAMFKKHLASSPTIQ